MRGGEEREEADSSGDPSWQVALVEWRSSEYRSAFGVAGSSACATENQNMNLAPTCSQRGAAKFSTGPMTVPPLVL